MQVIEHRDSRIPAFSEVSAAIQSREQERVYQQEVAKYMVELEQKSMIVADPPPEAAGFRRLMKSPETGQDDVSRILGAPTAPAPGTPAPQTPTSGAPGALPQPKPVNDTPPPVMAPPSQAPQPPPAKPPQG